MDYMSLLIAWGLTDQNPDSGIVETVKNALVHASCDDQDAGFKSHNQVCSKAGGWVLSLCACLYLMNIGVSPRQSGFLKIQDNIVSAVINRLYFDYDVEMYVKKSVGEDRSQNNHPDIIKQVFGALFYSHGLVVAYDLLVHHVRKSDIQGKMDPKTSLQQYMQMVKKAFTYTLVDRNGPANQPTFRVKLEAPGFTSTVGEGSSKKKAEYHAAERFLRANRIHTEEFRDVSKLQYKEKATPNGYQLDRMQSVVDELSLEGYLTASELFTAFLHVNYVGRRNCKNVETNADYSTAGALYLQVAAYFFNEHKHGQNVKDIIKYSRICCTKDNIIPFINRKWFDYIEQENNRVFVSDISKGSMRYDVYCAIIGLLLFKSIVRHNNDYADKSCELIHELFQYIDSKNIIEYSTELNEMCGRLGYSINATVESIELLSDRFSSDIEVQVLVWNDNLRLSACAYGSSAMRAKADASEVVLRALLEYYGYDLNPDTLHKGIDEIVTSAKAHKDKEGAESTGHVYGDDNKLPVLNDYIVTSESTIVNNRVCVTCYSDLEDQRYNIPVKRPNGSIIGLYVCNALVCPLCRKQYITKKEWDVIYGRALRPSSNSKGYSDNYGSHQKRNTDYLGVPVAELEMTIGRAVPNASRSAQPSALSMMNKESFLKVAGYSTKVPVLLRRRILIDLLGEPSKREIIDMLTMNIRLKQRRPNYADAVAIWQEDLDYLVRFKP